jgi:DNA-binding CsgD family transcriptional regulator/MFS family permease
MALVEQTTSEPPKSELLTISPAALVGYLGFTLYCAWMFFTYLSPSFTSEVVFDLIGQQGFLLNRFIMMIPLSAVLFFAWQCSDKLSRKYGFTIMLAVASIASVAAFICFFFSGSNQLLQLVAWALAGVFQGFACILWSTYLCFVGERRILLFTAFCVGAGGILAALMSLLQPMAAIWINFSLSVLSMAAVGFYHFKIDANKERIQVASRLSDKRNRVLPKSAMSVVLYSLVLGFFVCYTVGHNVFPFGIVLGALAACAAGVVVMADTIKFHFISETFLTKLKMPITIVGLISLFISNSIIQMVCCFVVLSFFMVIYIVNLSSISEHTRIFKLSPVRLFGFARLENVLGFLLGALAYYLAFMFSQTSIQNTTIVILAVLLVLSVGVAFVFEDHYPYEGEQLRRAAKESKEHHLPAAKMVELVNVSQDDSQANSSKSFWMRRCAHFAQKYQLSPKEQEVLLLLARGRNAEYIQETLVVSKHTAKAHIYHIYQKSDVHSRQELIDKLEEMIIDEPR